jgi:CheY-like chemotaxis protein
VIIVTVQPKREGDEISALSIVDWVEKPLNESHLVKSVRQAVNNTSGDMPLILHVEDDADIHQIVKILLGDTAKVESATNLKEAKEKLRTNIFDLVLLDLGLPDGMGTELVSVLNTLNPVPRVVIFSALDSATDFSEQVAVSLTKSRTSTTQLLKTIKQLVG